MLIYSAFSTSIYTWSFRAALSLHPHRVRAIHNEIPNHFSIVLWSAFMLPNFRIEMGTQFDVSLQSAAAAFFPISDTSRFRAKTFG